MEPHLAESATSGIDAAQIEPGETKADKPNNFYRPELDAVRFLAFLAVFLFHAPHAPRLEWLVRAGYFGLPLFFFLSAFLITELLLREQAKLGTIHLRAFYIRRSLRIWPLYYFGVFTAVLWGIAVPSYKLTNTQFAYLLLLLPGFAGAQYNFNPAGVLWSISVEEIFYLIWPIAGKARAFVWACAALFLCATITLLVNPDYWYTPLSQFLFFALGGLLALSIHRINIRLPIAMRVFGILAGAGIAVYAATVQIPILTFYLGAVACALVIISILNIEERWIPRPAIYLGKISYGLYVFHATCINATERLFGRYAVPLGGNRRALAIQFVAFAATVLFAAISYRYFETPFLKLKRRFEFVKSRPV